MGAADYAGVRWPPEDGRPVVIHADADAPIRTTGAPSVFSQRPPRRAVGAPDPRSLKVIDHPPPPVEPRNPPSPWRAVYAAMVPGKGIELTEAQAKAFCAWARQHKLRLTRRRIDADTYHVWLKEET